MAHYRTIDLLKITNLKTSISSCVCGLECKTTHDNGNIECQQCPRSFHKACLKIKQKKNKILCPICFIGVMDPLSEVQQCYFIGMAKGKINEVMFYKTQIEVFEGIKQNVQLRCIRLRENYLKDHSWPNCCEIYSNDLSILACKPLGQHASNKKRKDHPKTIKNFKPQNSIKIIYTYDRYREDQYRIDADEFLFGVFRVRPLLQEELLQRIISYNDKIQQPRSIISEVLRQNENAELRTEQIEICLLCPYTAMPIKIPARGINCTHVKCFDLKGIIWAHRKERTWKCPFCNESCEKIIIDRTIRQIIQSSQKDLKSVIFTNDVEKFKVIEKSDDEEEVESEKSEPIKKPPAFIVLDDEQDIEVPCETHSITQSMVQKKQQRVNMKTSGTKQRQQLETRQFQQPEFAEPETFQTIIQQYRDLLQSLRQGRFTIDRPLSRPRELECVKLYRQLFEL